MLNEDPRLFHGALGTYDKAEAHQYYLNNRQLKGRTPAVAKPVSTSRSSSSGTAAKDKSGAKAKVTTPPKPKMTTAQIKARTAALQGRLATLKKVLAELTKQAKARSGVEAKPVAKTAAAEATAKDAQAKSSAKYYDKNKAAILAKAKADAAANDPTDLEAKIAEVTAKIAKMREKLASVMK